MGLGPLHTVTLAEAREAARDARKVLLHGLDPIDERKRQLAELKALERSKISFEACTENYIQMQAVVWRSVKHRQQWENTLRSYAFPHFGALNVGEVDTRLVLKALGPIWTTKTETATRVRERIERVLAWATAHGYRHGDNPARWGGHLEMLLPNPAKCCRTKHHAAIPVGEVSSFFAQLKDRHGVGAKALQFTILTACRSGEALGATWDEIDLERQVWIVQPERTKAGRLSRIPLSTAAMEVLLAQKGADPVLVFPRERQKGQNAQPLSSMAMPSVLRRIQRDGVTVHGFRSTFRDWAAERTNYSRELAEIALEHRFGSATENAYFRSDLLEERRKLMDEWGIWCTTWKRRVE